MNVGQAHAYATNAMAKFLETGRAALKAGAHPDTLITVTPSVIEREAEGTELHDSL